MVFTTATLCIRSRGPDKFWKRRQIFKMASHFYGRSRNCYVLAIKKVHRALANATKGRECKKNDMTQLWETRITAGCEQHGFPYRELREGLHRSNIHLNRKSLADLAIWEPFSFKALTQVAWTKMKEDRDEMTEKVDSEPPNNVITPKYKMH